MEGSTKKAAGFLRRPVPMTQVDWLVDCVIAAGAFGFGLLQLTFSANIFVPDDFIRRMLGIHAITPSVLGIAATLATSLPLVFRRRYPWPVFVCSLGLWAAFEWTGGVESFSAVSPLVALFTLACECGRGQTVAAGAAMLAVTLFSAADGRNSALAALLVAQNAALVVAVSFAGYALKARGDYLEAAEARLEQAERLRASEARRAEEAERTRESEASRRVEAERVRIAREVHDITAHSLSAVSVQAAAAMRLVDSDPAAAKDAIGEIRATSKSALADMRSMIGVLRGGDSAAETSPTAGTERLGDLASFLEGAGVECELSVDGYDRSRVPAHVDVAVFGIAREACTNIVRHSEAGRAAIGLAAEGGEAVLSVCDDGKGMQQSAPESGHGIEGMRERVRLLGGSLDVGPSEKGGTCVCARIPVPCEKEA